MLSEFSEKDYLIFHQQILGLDLSQSELEEALARVLETKSRSLQRKIQILLEEGKRKLVDLAFERARMRYKTQLALRFLMFEQDEMGE